MKWAAAAGGRGRAASLAAAEPAAPTGVPAEGAALAAWARHLRRSAGDVAMHHNSHQQLMTYRARHLEAMALGKLGSSQGHQLVMDGLLTTLVTMCEHSKKIQLDSEEQTLAWLCTSSHAAD